MQSMNEALQNSQDVRLELHSNELKYHCLHSCTNNKYKAVWCLSAPLGWKKFYNSRKGSFSGGQAFLASISLSRMFQ